jgi:hypothetical protein
MTIEDELSELREHVRELQDLIVSIIPDDRVARLEEINLLRRTIAERTDTRAVISAPAGSEFVLHRQYVGERGYGFFVQTTNESVIAYVERLHRLGMDIEVEGDAP